MGWFAMDFALNSKRTSTCLGLRGRGSGAVHDNDHGDNDNNGETRAWWLAKAAPLSAARPKHLNKMKILGTEMLSRHAIWQQNVDVVTQRTINPTNYTAVYNARHKNLTWLLCSGDMSHHHEFRVQMKTVISRLDLTTWLHTNTNSKAWQLKYSACMQVDHAEFPTGK